MSKESTCGPWEPRAVRVGAKDSEVRELNRTNIYEVLQILKNKKQAARQLHQCVPYTSGVPVTNKKLTYFHPKISAEFEGYFLWKLNSHFDRYQWELLLW